MEASLSLFDVHDPDAVRQLRRIEEEVMTDAKRWYGVRDGGELASIAALVELEGVGYLDNVATFPGARGRGYAARSPRMRSVRQLPAVRRACICWPIPTARSRCTDGSGFESWAVWRARADRSPSNGRPLVAPLQAFTSRPPPVPRRVRPIAYRRCVPMSRFEVPVANGFTSGPPTSPCPECGCAMPLDGELCDICFADLGERPGGPAAAGLPPATSIADGLGYDDAIAELNVLAQLGGGREDAETAVQAESLLARPRTQFVRERELDLTNEAQETRRPAR